MGQCRFSVTVRAARSRKRSALLASPRMSAMAASDKSESEESKCSNPSADLTNLANNVDDDVDDDGAISF